MKPSNLERDTEICQAYRDGRSVQQISRDFRLSKQRISQILGNGSVERVDRPQSLSNRNEFLGINVSQTVKDALMVEADKRGVSMSSMTSTVLHDMLLELGYPVEAEDILKTEETVSP